MGLGTTFRWRSLVSLIVVAMAAVLVPSLPAQAGDGCAACANLVVTDIVMSPTVSGPGVATTITGTVKNVGAFASGDSHAEILDPFTNTVSSHLVLALDAGEEQDVSVGINPTTGGSKPFTVTADADGEVVETSEVDNDRTESFEFGADLRVDHLSVSNAAPGGTVSINDATKNFGSPSTASTTTVVMSADNILDEADAFLRSRFVAALVNNQSDQLVSDVTIPQDTPLGTYFAIAVADAGAIVPRGTKATT